MAVTLGSARSASPLLFPHSSGGNRSGDAGRYRRMSATEDVGKHAIKLPKILYWNIYYIHIYF